MEKKENYPKDCPSDNLVACSTDANDGDSVGFRELIDEDGVDADERLEQGVNDHKHELRRLRREYFRINLIFWIHCDIILIRRTLRPV